MLNSFFFLNATKQRLSSYSCSSTILQVSLYVCVFVCLLSIYRWPHQFGATKFAVVAADAWQDSQVLWQKYKQTLVHVFVYDVHVCVFGKFSPWRAV